MESSMTPPHNQHRTVEWPTLPSCPWTDMNKGSSYTLIWFFAFFNVLAASDADLHATLSVPLVWQFIRRHRKPKRTSTKYSAYVLLLADLQMSTRSLAQTFIHRLRTKHATHEEGRRLSLCCNLSSTTMLN